MTAALLDIGALSSPVSGQVLVCEIPKQPSKFFVTIVLIRNYREDIKLVNVIRAIAARGASKWAMFW